MDNRIDKPARNRVLRLASHDLLELADARGATVRIGRGTVWVTQQGDGADIVLTAGDTWTIEHHGLTIVEARGDVELTVLGSRPIGSNVRRRHIPWTRRLSAWIERAAERHLRRPWVPHV